jgi:hypothetical protein
MTRQRGAAGVASLPPTAPPGATWGGGTACSPFALSPEARGRDGGAGSHANRLEASSRRIGDPDPAVRFLVAGPTNCHAALVEGRQRGQNRRPQP